jgi:hypothetical protein
MNHAEIQREQDHGRRRVRQRSKGRRGRVFLLLALLCFLVVTVELISRRQRSESRTPLAPDVSDDASEVQFK